MPSYQYRKSHYGDKTVVRSSYLHNGISYTGKMASFYWISPLVCFSWWALIDGFVQKRCVVTKLAWVKYILLHFLWKPIGFGGLRTSSHIWYAVCWNCIVYTYTYSYTSLAYICIIRMCELVCSKNNQIFTPRLLLRETWICTCILYHSFLLQWTRWL